MRASTIFATVATAFTLTAASPSASRQSNTTLTNFLLVTTSQRSSTTESSQLTNASATSLFDPFNQESYYLRTISAGYGSLPRFNLTNGDLHTLAMGIEGVGEYVYNSTGKIEAGKEFVLSPSKEPAGNLALADGYLLTVSGEEEGWTICDGDLGQDVLYWKGNGTSCTPTYIHAVADAPY
ncbi:hypothetical protein B0A50_03897 [Salinomyces thailandicus]|uniref:Cell wall protein PhiA n=1 Tax=Salinomyces thailandicus TaxID=706561 RepID=A0A4U0U0M9_9PEZI|nr:hypothetical protein B0A50_03897 [Salinomyces thailandica]